MALFLISLILLIICAFFVTSIFEQKNFIKIFIYFVLTMFGSLVLNVEILSIFSKISVLGILLINFLFAIISGFLWIKRGKPRVHIKFKRFFKRIYFALMSDKYLLVLGFGFIFMCMISLFLIALMPIVNPDAEAYHALRSLFWIGNGNLNHFSIGDARALIMPINSEILYLWIFIFIKKQFAIGIFSFIGFLLSITSLYGIMGNLKLNERQKLWVIFILASLPSVIVQISGTETDIIIAGLILASIYLYWSHFKSNNKTELYFSALAYALAMGTKNTALIMLIPVGLWMIWLSHFYLRKECLKPFLIFIGYGVINFLIFSSFSYILNFIDWKNIFGLTSFVNLHKNLYGFKGFLSGLIHHLFLFFDFTGFNLHKTFGVMISDFQNYILSACGLDLIPDSVFSKATESLNNSLTEPCMGMGILGFLVFLPCWIFSMIRFLFSHKRQDIFVCSFGFLLLGAIIALSAQLTFMFFNIRFLTSFCAISAVVIAYSYSRKNSIIKFIITGVALFGLLLISTHLSARPFVRVYGYFKQGATISQIREVAKCSLFFKTLPAKNLICNEMCILEKKIRSLNPRNKILYFGNIAENLLIIKMLQFENYNIDFALLEDVKKIDFRKYNIIIIADDSQASSVIRRNDGTSLYYPAENVKCQYYVRNNIPVNSIASKDIPFFSFCTVGENFYNAIGFKLADKITILNARQIKGSESLTYKFYENIKNPKIN